MGLFTRQDRDALGTGAAAFAIVALVIALVALVTVAGDNGGGDSGGSVSAGGTTVTLTEFALSPDSVTVPVGGEITVVNDGTVAHNVSIDGTDLKTKDLNPGDSATLDVSDLDEGMYTMICAVSGHKEAGMVGDLMIGSSSDHAAHMREHRPLAVRERCVRRDDEGADGRVRRATDRRREHRGRGQRPARAEHPPGRHEGVHGDRVDRRLAGRSRHDRAGVGLQRHGPGAVDQGRSRRQGAARPEQRAPAVDRHPPPRHRRPNAMDGVPDVTQPPVKPGDSFAYEFVAKGPALGIYHSHHHAEHQVPDGLFGVFQVGDMPLPDGTAAIAQEVPMVLNDAGVIGLSLNGKSFPATAPVMAKVGETTQIDYFNEGLQIHPMHLHGIPQLVIAKDGFPVPEPYYVDTLAVAPGERYSVLVTPAAGQEGVWAFHCHILNHAEGDDGMFGMVTTMIVQ